MALPPYCSADISAFDFVHGILRVPSQFVWYRAYDPALSQLPEHPLFYGDKTVAWLYARATGRPLGEFQPRRDLRLLDIRYVAAILSYLLTRDLRDQPIIAKLVASLGLCSMTKQIELLSELTAGDSRAADSIDRMLRFRDLAVKPDWVHPFEIQGVRVGITEIDYDVMAWLKELFGGVVDGIIAPAMPSPFHDQVHPDIDRSMLYQELVLFSPASVLRFVQDVPVGARLEYNRPTLHFNDFVLNEFRGQWLQPPRPIRYRAPGGKETATATATTAPLTNVRDAYAEALMSHPRLLKDWKRQVLQWRPTIRRLQKAHRFLRQESLTFWTTSPQLAAT